jgi:hypothetical protein
MDKKTCSCYNRKIGQKEQEKLLLTSKYQNYCYFSHYVLSSLFASPAEPAMAFPARDEIAGGGVPVSLHGSCSDHQRQRLSQNPADEPTWQVFPTCQV